MQYGPISTIRKACSRKQRCCLHDEEEMSRSIKPQNSMSKVGLFFLTISLTSIANCWTGSPDTHRWSQWLQREWDNDIWLLEGREELLPIDPFYTPFVARSLAAPALPLQLRTRWSCSPRPPPYHVTTTTYLMSSVFSTLPIFWQEMV